MAIFLVWTVALIIKMILGIYGYRIYTHKIDSSDESSAESILMLLDFLIAEVIPILPTLDKNFINILLMTISENNQPG